MNTKNKKNIIDGYKGVMELDLTNIDPKYHKLYIDQHYKDIKDYKGHSIEILDKEIDSMGKQMEEKYKDLLSENDLDSEK